MRREEQPVRQRGLIPEPAIRRYQCPRFLNTDPTQLDVSSWCGWHNDHGSLTGLVPAMFMNKEGQVVANPDPSAGLYIRARNGDLVKAVIPAEYMVFQIGERFLLPPTS